ncbi:MAG TPA: DUF5723 family protein [Longimicrobiales bacterium]
MTKAIRRTLAAVVALAIATPLAAQQTNPSAASVGLGDSYTAMARGLSAIRWNPAGLAMPGTSGFAISVLPVVGMAGLDPVSLGDIAEYEDTIIPNNVKQEWLDEIIEEGGQAGNGGAGLTYIATNIGRVGFQLGTSTVATANVSPGIARLLLFGNADGDSAIDVTAEGSEMNFGVVSTAALSYAHPLTLSLGPLPDQHFAVGATVKYSIGHGLVSGFDAGSRASSDPLEIEVAFPMIISVAPDSVVVNGDTIEAEEESAWNKGSGFGLDVGAAWQGGIFSAGVSIQNLINTFSWNEDDMWYSPGEALFDSDTTDTNFDQVPLSEAPDAVRERLDDLVFAPTFALAAAVDLPMVKVTGEIRHRAGEALTIDSGTHVGVGAEFRPLGFLPIRAGVASVNGGFNLGAGIGLEFGVFNLNLAGSRRTSDLGTDVAGALSISFGGI